MKIILAIKSGIARTIPAWKPVLITWVISLILSWMIVVPVKAGFKAVLGKSMITEKLMNGLNIDVLGDLGANLHSMLSSMVSGLMILSLAAIVTGVFLAGGLFDSVKQGYEKFNPGSFFMACARNFWSFFIIMIIVYLIIVVFILAVVVLPVSIASNSVSAPEGITFRVARISLAAFIAGSAIFFLVADYARAWQARQPVNRAFRALGNGFSHTFGSFLSSFPLMIIMLLLQALILWCAYKLMTGYTPSSGGGVLLLFIVSQLIFIVRIFFKVLRYASLTSLLELKQTKNRPGGGNSSGTGPGPAVSASAETRDEINNLF